MNAHTKIALLVMVTLAATTTSPAQVRLLHDINDQPLGTVSSGPREMVALGNLVICTTLAGGQSIGVFAIDSATGVATRLSGASAPARELTRVGNRVYWAIHGSLGMTDGTVAGTRTFSVGQTDLTQLTPLGPALCFAYDVGGGSTRLGLLDTNRGRIVRFEAPSYPSFPRDPEALVAVGTTSLFFTAIGDGAGRELWELSDVLTGPLMNYDLSSGTDSTAFRAMAAKVEGVTGPSYLLVSATPFGGTERVYLATPGRGLPGYRPIALGNFAASEIYDQTGTNRSFLAGVDPATNLGEELYVLNGLSDLSIRLVADLAPGPASSSPRFAGTFGGRVYFAAADGSHGRELWSSDGVAAGTGMVEDIRVGAGSGIPAGALSAATVNVGGSDVLMFLADDGATGREPWLTDGTINGTRQLRDVYPGPLGSEPHAFAGVTGSRVVFAATDRLLGAEPWITDGTSAGTRVLVDLDRTPGGHVTADSNPAHGVRYGDHVLFAADDGQRGIELWRNDGAWSTQLVADLRVGAPSSSPRDFTVVGDLLFFTAANDAGTRRLWLQRGPLARPRVVTSATHDPSDLCAVGDLLFFQNQDPATGGELWKSDGTSSGTVLVRDLVAGPGSSDPTGIVALAGRAIFRATHPVTGTEIWRSDGTARGTLFLRDIVPGSVSSSPRFLTPVGDAVYFTASGRAEGRELWKTTGTTPGTTLVADIRAGTSHSDPKGLTRVGERLFFMADDGVHGREIWRSDGTTAGTQIVRDVWPGAQRGALESLLARGDLLFFSAMDGVHGPEPWRSDGTAAGTFALGDLVPGAVGSFPRFEAASGSRYVWFSARTPNAGRELWRSDGTVAGTAQFSDILPGPDSSLPTALGVIGSRFVFAAEDPFKGREPCFAHAGATTITYGYGCSFDRRLPSLYFEDLVLGGFATVTLDGVRPGSFAFLALGSRPLGQPGRLASGCWLYPDAASVVVLGPFVPSAGRFQLPLVVPNDRVLLAFELVWQGLAAPSPAPLGFDMSAGVVTQFGR